jgi:hypothetical protein
MPSLSFFIDEYDLHMLVDRLNADPEIAFIVPEGSVKPVQPLPPENNEPYRPAELSVSVCFAFEIAGTEGSNHQQWKAVRAVKALKDGKHSLWHVPGGPLPLIRAGSVPPYPPISDPWAGWTGSASFGTGCHPWIRLQVWTRHHPYTEQELQTLHEVNDFWAHKEDKLVVSGFQWTGGHFHPAPPQSQRWWNRMRGWVNRNAIPLGAGFWAFPSALQKLKNGMRYYSRNFDLDDGIRKAEKPK